MTQPFADYGKSYQNISRSLNKDRKVAIIYICQDPIIAWNFTKKREALEGRRVPKQTFIKAFFEAKENVNKAKEEFGNRIELWLITKNFEQGVENTYFNIDNIDNYIKIEYTPQSLEEVLEE